MVGKILITNTNPIPFHIISPSNSKNPAKLYRWIDGVSGACGLSAVSNWLIKELILAGLPTVAGDLPSGYD